MSYKKCPVCNKKLSKRKFLFRPYRHCRACGHRTCDGHYNGNRICHSCSGQSKQAETQRQKQQVQQDQKRLEQAITRVRLWCTSNEYDGAIQTQSLDYLKSSLNTAFQVVTQNITQQQKEVQIQFEECQELIRQLNFISESLNSASFLEMDELIRRLPVGSEQSELLTINQKYSSKRLARIVAFGPMNHGKSSLLNVLIEKNNHFQVADARKTTSIEEYIYEDIIYRDVPGWDSADSIDNQTALIGLDDCDVWLYNHDINLGELNLMDLRCLQSFVEHIASPQQSSLGLIICLSKIDKKDQVDQIKNHIESQLNHISIASSQGLPYLAIHTISTKDFMIGIESESSLKKREHFINQSGILELKDSIREAMLNRGLISKIQYVKQMKLTVQDLLEVQNKRQKKIQQSRVEIEHAFNKVQLSYQALKNSL